jgi:Zn-dependent peptidase ImmA (M78 family)/DNA-binding XRE family transcriptional regulator
MSSFNPSRLRVARKRRRLNKTKLAEAIGVDLRTVSAYERGEYEPASGTLALIAKTLRFPVGFFGGDDLHEPTSATASFRSLARMSAANREAALASGALAFLLNDWIESRFTLPSCAVSEVREESPEAAAMALRQHWELGERPIRNMVHLLEAKGVRVFSMFEDTVEVDAFSLWRETTPFVFLNTMKSAERSRFDAAHELGHLVLHRHAGAPQGREAEHEANRFASAFLMPRSSVLAVAPVFPNLDRLIELKRLWIVSVSAIAYRLHALGLLSDWHYTRLCIEIAERGYRTNEPQPAPREMSQVLPKVFAAFREDGVTLSDIAAALQVEPNEIDKLVFQLMLVSLKGGASTRTAPSRRASLHVVQ